MQTSCREAGRFARQTPFHVHLALFEGFTYKRGMIIERFPGVQDLSTEEKWTLMDELEASLLASSEQEVADPKILAGLAKRMAEYEAHPETGTTWEAVREKLFLKK